ncbi:hypothetical protein Tco_0689240 [Tanacetum coccineum]
MTGVPRHTAEHRLNREGCQPVRQKRRGQAPDKNKAIQEEVAKLVEAEIMREVHYHDWLSNPVMLNLSVGTLSSVSWTLTRDTTKYIWRKRTKKKWLSILTKEFSATKRCRSASRNAGATNQRLIDKAFEKQIGRNWKKSGSSGEATLTPNAERSSKPQWKAG